MNAPAASKVRASAGLRERDGAKLAAALGFAMIVTSLLAFALFRPTRSGPIEPSAITARPKLLDTQYTRNGPASAEERAGSAAPASSAR